MDLAFFRREQAGLNPVIARANRQRRPDELKQALFDRAGASANTVWQTFMLVH